MVLYRMDLNLVFSQLIRMNDLNIWEGLVHVGCNREVYADALKIFCGDLGKKSEELGKFLENENWKDYIGAVHAIKGGLAGIGAWLLAEKFRELEDASRKEDYVFCRRKSGKVLKEIEQFTAALRSCALFTENTMPREQVSLDYLEKKLSELYLLCSIGSSAEADALAKELRTKTSGGEIDTIVDTICTHVENLDYHLVLETLGGQSYIKS